MQKKTFHKPRYTLSEKTKNKLWIYKDSFLRHFYGIRARRLMRTGTLFVSIRLVANSKKWQFVRKVRRPFRNSMNNVQNFSSNILITGKPEKLTFRSNFYLKQQIRFFYGNIKDSRFQLYFRKYKSTLKARTSSVFTILESRLDRILYRRRAFPTIFAANQYIYYIGLEVNGLLVKTPRKIIKISDIVSIVSTNWEGFYSNFYVRIHFRRWGRYIIRRRVYFLLKKTFSYYKNKANSREINFVSDLNTYYKKRYKPSIFIHKYNKYISTLNKVKSLYVQLNTIQKNNNCNNNILSNLLVKLKLFLNILMIRKHRIITFGSKSYKNKYKFTNRLRRYRHRKKYEFISKRFEKIVRLKPLHFYIPQHLQRDFRTLRVIKRNAPNVNNIFYAFRGSLIAFHSFFGSRGY